MPRHSAYIEYDPSAGGISKIFHRDYDGDWIYETVQDVEPIARANEWIRNHGTTWVSKERDLRLDAHIPLIYRQKWIDEFGVDFLDPDPDVQRKVDRILDSPEYLWMRTNTFRLA